MDDERRGHEAGAQRGTMPGHVTVRHPTIADGPRTIELINAAETHDIGEPMLELSDIATDWLGPGVDLDRDVILVEEHERLVAWAQVNGERGDADVHPDERGRGLGSGVLDWMEARVLARTPLDQAAVLGQTIPDGDVAARVLFQRRGYERRWTSWVLRLPSETQIRRPALPPGVDVRAVRPGEERAVHAVIDGAFSEWEGRDPRPFEDWQARVLRHAAPELEQKFFIVGFFFIFCTHATHYTVYYIVLSIPKYFYSQFLLKKPF